jgi:DNA-binding NtrC family response regulator
MQSMISVTPMAISEIMSFESYLTWYLDCRKHTAGEKELPTLEALNRDYIGYLMDVTDYDMDAVADILRLPSKELTKRLDQYNLWL